jgi:hypothetical protein
MDMSYTLCVIDMQAIFSSSQEPRVQQSCIREIKKAIRDRSVILFVEYAGYPATIPALTDIVAQANYKRAYHVIKSRNDGGQEVTDFLTKHHLPKMNMRVCGVNTDYCVRETVDGIRRFLPTANLHVIADACGSTWDHKSGLRQMKQVPNVKVIRAKGLV